MCTHFLSADSNSIKQRFWVDVPVASYKPEVFPGYLAPIIRRPTSPQNGMECIAANFGLIPPWATDDKIGRHTYNARTETVGEKPSFRHAWRQRQFCLIPMRHFSEPNYETGKAVRWHIYREDEQDFAVAGIWERWSNQGNNVLSFSMLTINADGHPLMGRFHRPADEKRSLVVVPPDQYEAWLAADTELARTFLSLAALAPFRANPATEIGQSGSLF